ncbi:MAG: helix-turn-helix transcriptional regulator [Pseudodesulfovibrio sp.]|jgi:poly-beta-hydroxybutyrate-responsive repressor|uniref:PadR family transcriptional regulator n=1 Tax=Pseudodesulfovibrio indicus TaxID=1716143 RepID=A0A126QLM9_9BACT|nr:helix-turn-helix transcriptional regulator [Pseudodesulfovibrio indicus]AMK10811.1 PadR family transcriptional regulator [Pseudodesulfovibrio indicus]TDT91803.1 PadR family transcriptional regulator [Pseudodesulfovibrio indicus]
MSQKVGGGKPQRYVQPSLLMALKAGPSYGYQLIQTIADYGFMRDEAPPGMIYRHLRQMDEEGLVSSSWDAEGDGPAKRVYSVTAEGLEILEAWILHMERQRDRLDAFIRRYRES